MNNIFIPSKGRAKTSQLLKFAESENEPIICFIEPQEEAIYKTAYPTLNFHVLPLNNQGITFVRNYIKAYALENLILDYWMLDDDISGLYFRAGTKLVRSNFSVLNDARAQFIKAGAALGALEYRQYAWSASKPFIENSFCDAAVWVNAHKLLYINYRHNVEGKEDRDFAMQVIKNGMKTMRTTLYAFSNPENGSNAGGLKESFYDAGKESACVNAMVTQWGEHICTPIVKPGGRHDVKINWKEINSTQTTLF